MVWLLIIDKVQNKFPRIITGATKFTLIASMDIQTEPEPINGKKYTFNLTESCARLPVDRWKNYVIVLKRIRNTKKFYNTLN